MGLFVSLQNTQTKLSCKMARIVASVALLACSTLAAPQFQGDSSNARILQEQRFNAGAGKFGSAFAQEDGVVYREESGGNNERIGQYSYVGDDGKTYTVKYSAGVNGFRILDGAHIPSGGQNSANAIIDDEVKEYDYEYYDETKPDSPFVNPHDPSHRQEFLLAGNLAGHLAQRVFPTEQTVLHQQPGQRFQAPGQIQLDRFQDGFNFKFQAQK